MSRFEIVLTEEAYESLNHLAGNKGQTRNLLVLWSPKKVITVVAIKPHP